MSVTRFPHTCLYLWTAVVAAVTIISGLFSLGAGLGIDSGLLIPADPVGGCILLLIGAILVTGLWEGKIDRARWVQYGYTGLLLLLIFGAATILIGGADALSALMEGESADPGSMLWSGFIWGLLLALPAYPAISRILSGCSRREDT